MSGPRKKIVRERLAECDLKEHVDCLAQRSAAAPPRWYRGSDVPMGVIRRFARQVVERFQPEEIILFGSYAYGAPHADSDVDILVVMPARNQIDQAVRIDAAIDAPFPLDLIVRTPENLNWRLKEGDSFLREIVTRGKVLYEKNVIRSSRARPTKQSSPRRCLRVRLRRW